METIVGRWPPCPVLQHPALCLFAPSVMFPCIQRYFFLHPALCFLTPSVIIGFRCENDSKLQATSRQHISKAAGKQIKQLELFMDEEDFGKYLYSCFVTALDLPAKIVYDSYRGRADSENRIKELKNDFSIDDFVTNNFWVTEACGNFIVMAYLARSLKT